jgi:hypothetical protein
MASIAEGRTGGWSSWRLSWGAVLAGVLLALAAHIVLGLVGAAIGFAAAPADSKGLGASAGIWALLTPFVATLLGAWLACRLANAHDAAHGNLHGILVWCIGLIAGALFLTGTMASGAMSAGTAASGNLGAAQRTLRDAGAAPAPADRTAAGTSASGGTTAREAQARQRTEDAAKAAAATAGGGAIASIAGLIGALAGSGLSRRRRDGRGLGWRIAVQRRDERRHMPAGQHAGDQGSYPGAGAYTQTTETSRTVSPGDPRGPGGGADPFHH